ncbi:MAG: hypothetical protein JW892_09375 [Anaerolineae bacterium]|nr:hypothetical protein [Anaerolineae bacterium]
MTSNANSDSKLVAESRREARRNRKGCLSKAGIVLLACVALILGLGGFVTGASGIRRSGTIPEPWLAHLSLQAPSPSLPKSTLAPIPHIPIPDHPFMAQGAGNNMHCDAYMSDTYQARGPQSSDARVTSRTQGFGGYGTIAFDPEGRLVAVYSNGGNFQLELLDPDTLQELAAYDLPPRSKRWILEGTPPWEYLGAGMYFYLDEQNRAVVPTTENTLRVVQVPDLTNRTAFELVREYDLRAHVVSLPFPRQDSVAWVLPDWDGTVYWFATTAGMVGTVNLTTGAVHTLRLEGEIIENSFAVGEDGVFILSDYALYRFRHAENGVPVAEWRTPYDRGPAQKPGHITRGSGTSVTLTGAPDGFVIIADNAEPQINVLFVRRSDGAVMCSAPVFEPGRSGTDVSTVGFEVADASGNSTGITSALIENNWGHHTFPRSHPTAGLTRVDAARQPDGTYQCREVWSSDEKSIGVFKLSLGNGLAYMYWREETGLMTQWVLTGIDWRTGETVYRQRTGAGLGYNNWAGALFVHPDGGIVYSTAIFGLVAVRDGVNQEPVHEP